jgi:hypothetical protein
MKIRHIVVVAMLAIIGALVWKSELWIVARPGDRPRPLALVAPEERRAVTLDVILPAVPVGSQRVEGGTGVLLVHYWAPWERHSREQAKTLDSLRRMPELSGMRVTVACCDPFPSVTRYVARERLRLNVLIDGVGDLRRVLPCPSVPYTYVLDAHGRIAVAQPGEVDWWADETRRALRSLLAEEPPRPAGSSKAIGAT